MNDIFQGIQADIDNILKSARHFFGASDDMIDDAAIEIYIKMIPTIRDLIFFDTEGAVKFIEEYKEDHRRKYLEAEDKSTNHTTEFSDIEFGRSQEHKFFHGMLIKVADLIMDEIKLIQPKEDSSPQEGPDRDLHSNIFANSGYYLWEYIFNNFIPKKRGRQSGISFFYHKMYNDGYIRVTPKVFGAWVSKEFEAEAGQLRSYKESKSQAKLSQYKTALKRFKGKQF